MYYPDKWCLLRVEGDDPHYRVFASWFGGYAKGDSWRLNSGITNVEETESTYEFYGSSGSCYVCGKNDYGMTRWSSSILDKIIENASVACSLITEKPDIMSMQFGNKLKG